MKIKEKAWGLLLGDIEEGYLYDTIIVYAENRNKAKSKMWVECNMYHNVELLGGVELSYLNVPIQRLKSADKYEFEGQVKSKQDIEYIQKRRERDTEIEETVKNNPDALCYVLKGRMYWRPNSAGYTEYKTKAGIYPIKEAAQIIKSSSLDRYERMMLIDREEHNKELQEQIDDLKTRLL
jgi:hypothetical protein